MSGYAAEVSDDAVDVLRGEHVALEDLFRRVASPDEDRRKVLKRLMQAMTSHAEIEKHIVAPIVEDRISGGGEIASRLDDQYARIQHILTLLERRKIDSPDAPGLVTQLLDINKAHIADAEHTIFPGLCAALSEQELSDLGQRIVHDQQRQLTHAHPIVSGNGPIAGIAHKAAQIIDGIRDRFDQKGPGN